MFKKKKKQPEHQGIENITASFSSDTSSEHNTKLIAQNLKLLQGSS